MSILDTFRERKPFPGQDPWVISYRGEYLLVQSASGDRRLVVKRFKDLRYMDRYSEHEIWAPPEHGPGADHARQLWAPELHRVGDRWYVYYAASDGHSANHKAYVLGADDPLGPYQDLGKVADPGHDYWAIDMTVFEQGERLYAVWSGWEGPDDGFPQNLYIAPMDNPWTISGERRLISRPEHGWEMSVAPINEGPEVLRNPNTGGLFIVYSADASWTQAYKMGLLEWTGEGGLLDAASWRKLARPFFTGGGHGCVVDSPNGPQLVYHRKLGFDPGWADREIRTAPFGWDADGYPTVHAGGHEGAADAPAASASGFTRGAS